MGSGQSAIGGTNEKKKCIARTFMSGANKIQKREKQAKLPAFLSFLKPQS